ncbi:MAG: hypothetical protein ACRDQ4_22940 [Pseudonocardiaceae bacterium]
MPTDEQRETTIDQVRGPATTPRVARWLTCGVGVAGGTLAATGQLGMFALVAGVLTSLPMLLIVMLVVVAVFSPHPVRRKTAERILSQLLNALTGTQQQ